MLSRGVLTGLVLLLLLPCCATTDPMPARAQSCSIKPPGDVDVPCLEIPHCSRPPAVVSNFTVMGEDAGLPKKPVAPEPTSASICYTDEVRQTEWLETGSLPYIGARVFAGPAGRLESGGQARGVQLQR